MRTGDFSTISHVPQGKKTIAVEVPDGSPWIKLPLGNEMLDAHFDRQSHNLLVETAERQIVVENYFAGESFPALLSETGKKIAGASVDNLAGPESPWEFAGPVEAGGEVIGSVEKLKGSVTVTRNGQEIELEQGDAVFQNDVIETEGDGSVGITFEDGSVFTLGADARMTLDEFVYDPATGDGSSSVNVIKGMFKFVSGEIAANNPGEMQVETPVATIGIRGTTGGGSVQGEGADNQFFLEPNADGTVGWFDVTTAQGTVPMNQPNTMVGLKSFNEAPPVPQFVPANQIKQAFAQVVEFAPAGKYEARQNTNSDANNQAQPEGNAGEAPPAGSEQNDGSEEAAPDAEAAGEEAAEGENAEQEAAGEEAAEGEGENAADATSEADESAADSDVSANGEQSGEALETFSGDENFDGEANAGEPGDAPEGDMGAEGPDGENVDMQDAGGAEGEPAGEPNGPEGDMAADGPAPGDAGPAEGPGPGDAAAAGPAPGDAPAPAQDFIATSSASEGGPNQSGLKKVSDVDTASSQTGNNAAGQTANGPNGPANPAPGLNPQGAVNAAGNQAVDPAGDPNGNQANEPANNGPEPVVNNTVNSNSFLQNQLATEQAQLQAPLPAGEQPLPPLAGEPLPQEAPIPPAGEVPPPPPVEGEVVPEGEVPPPPGAALPPSIYDLTATADSFLADAQDSTFIVDSAAMADFMAGNDTLDGGAGIDSLRIEAQGGAYALNTNGVVFANISSIEQFDINDSGVTLTLHDNYLSTLDGNRVIVDNHGNSISLDVANFSGMTGIAGVGTISVSGAAATDYFFDNEMGSSVDLDFSLSNGNNHIFLEGGSNNIASGSSGELIIFQKGGSSHNFTANSSANIDVTLENVAGANVVAGSTASYGNFWIEESSNVDITLSSGASSYVEIEDSSNVTVAGGASGSSYFSIEGSNSGLVMQGNSSSNVYDIQDFSGDISFQINATDDFYFQNILNGSTFNFEKYSATTSFLDFSNMRFSDFSITVVDENTDGLLDMKLSLAGSRDIILHDFFNGANNYNFYEMSGLRTLTDAAYQNYAVGEFRIGAQPVVGDTITIDGNVYTFVTTITASNQIEIGTTLTDTLDNIVTQINTDGLGVDASHDGSGAIWIKGNAAGTLTSLATDITGANVVDMEYNAYFQAVGTNAAPRAEYGTLNVSGTVLNDVMMAVETNQTLTGGDGDDTLYVGAGTATSFIEGGNGDDIFIKELAALTDSASLVGGAGTDTVNYADLTTNLIVDLSSSFVTDATTSFNDFLSGIEVILSGSGDDTITGGASDNTIEGGAGADSIDGGAGVDTASYASSTAAVSIDLASSAFSGGDAAGDILTNFENIEGSLHNDTIIGDATDNKLIGLAGDDSLVAGNGEDTLIGGLGNDTVVLGADGLRDFVELAAVGSDEIVSFEATGANNDVIDLSFVSGSPTIENYFQLLDAGNLTIQDDGTDIFIKYGVSQQQVAKLVGATGTTLDWRHFVTDEGVYHTTDGDDGSNDTIIGGSDRSDVLISDGVSDIHGYGGNDIISTNGSSTAVVAGDGDDVILLQNLASAYTLDGGDGDDVLRLEGLGAATLDLATFLGTSTLYEIETINLDGADLTNVFAGNIHDVTDGNALFIEGDGSETITLNLNDWQLTGAANLPGHIEAEAGYSTYIATSATEGEVALHVANNLTVAAV